MRALLIQIGLKPELQSRAASISLRALLTQINKSHAHEKSMTFIDESFFISLQLTYK